MPINFNVTGNIETNQIVPLILITFLENAFKHGVSNSSKNAFVNVNIDISENICFYMVENNKMNTQVNLEASGIGLQNVKRRLELSYPGKYTLDIIETDTTYKVKLNLNLV